MTDNHTDALNKTLINTDTDSPKSQSTSGQTPAQKAIADTIVAHTKNNNDKNIADKDVVQNLNRETIKDASVSVPSQTTSNSTVNSSEPKIKKFDITVAGTNYPVFCPTDEETELRAAEQYIDDFATTLKKDAPNISQENLLVLSCLTLYEKISAYEKNDSERQQQTKQNEALINKIIADAKSTL